ncbi:phage capsid scaffolding protein [Pseudomonas sp. StFLB209]|uniref:GPO family capsid scaffolding protein n=1 Tax=Pseudomonas sp. StFLB209 TaxID=1028989 RepID=UPI0004F731EE|nr:GPO family capsid scaffolding protein [Pseudomonas sp. StFLB209]BAP41307.1 phage capsid scaffolding protein [Pseudomonas sp. StFLB209]
MPRSLVSFWKRVAVSGPTADNREITVQELRDCADTYKLSRYTAVIWNEHEREPGSYGEVFAVRLVEDDPELEPGQVALEAQLKPNDKLLYLNDQGEKIFTSVEITPNFANSGRNYLTGLAVTDSPASLGTQPLYFKRGGASKRKGAFFTKSLPLGDLRENSHEHQVRGVFTALASLFKSFSDTGSSAPTPSPDEIQAMEVDEATLKALKALNDQHVIVMAGYQAILAPLFEGLDTEEVQEQVDAVGTAVQDVVDQAEEEGQFSRKGKGKDSKAEVKELSAIIGELNENMTKLMNTKQSRQLPRTTGAAGKVRGKGLR